MDGGVSNYKWGAVSAASWSNGEYDKSGTSYTTGWAGNHYGLTSGNTQAIVEYLEKFKKNLLIEMNKKLQIIIDTNKWNDLVIVGSESDKPEESSKDGDEKSSHGSRTKITDG